MTDCVRTALIVEDDPEKRDDIVSFVKAVVEVIEVFEATSVGEGSRKARTDQYDLFILDMVLPSFSTPGGGQTATGGQSIMRIIRRYAPNTPVILISQYPTVELDNEAVDVSSSADRLSKYFGINVVGSIHYTYDSKIWKSQLSMALEGVFQ